MKCYSIWFGEFGITLDADYFDVNTTTYSFGAVDTFIYFYHSDYIIATIERERIVRISEFDRELDHLIQVYPTE